MNTVGRLTNNGDLKLIGELNERLPSVMNGLIAHYPFDGTSRMGAINLLKNSNVEKTGSNEFLQYADLAPIFDVYGLVPYTISFDIKSANISSQNTMRVYMQNGSGARYSFAKDVPVTTQYTRQSVTIIPILANITLTQSMLAFYGLYGSGNIPTVKNVKVELGSNSTIWCPHVTEEDTSITVSNCTFNSDGILVEEATTNIVPNGVTNTYPTIGNGWGTYNTNQYTAGAYVSIGTITSVSNNIATYTAGTMKLKTYDIIKPQTSGGGLTAGVNYFIKVISPTQFTVHQYNSSQDGSQGLNALNSVINDIRVNINATNFPTMWCGDAHLPNSGIVKEIIKNGFSNGIYSHDCIRLHTEHRIDGVADGMAYGVNPSVNAGGTYSFSFYCKAISPNAIGKSVGFQVWDNGVYPIISSFTLSDSWKRISFTASFPNTYGTSLYWFPPSGIVWDLSEIQCEQKNFATSYTSSSRNEGDLKLTNVLSQGKGTVVLDVTFHEDDTVNGLQGSDQYCFSNQGNWNSANTWRFHDTRTWTILGSDGQYNQKILTSPMIREERTKLAFVYDDTDGTMLIYKNGILCSDTSKVSIGKFSNIGTNWTHSGHAQTTQYKMCQTIHALSFYNRPLSANEISKLHKGKFSITSIGNVIGTRITEVNPSMPNDTYYYPLDFDSKDINKIYGASEDTNTVYEDGSVWVGSATTNIYNPSWAYSGNNGAICEDYKGCDLRYQNAKSWKLTKTGTSNQWSGQESCLGLNFNVGDSLSVSLYYRTNYDIASFGGFRLVSSDWKTTYSTSIKTPDSHSISDGGWHKNTAICTATTACTNPIIADPISWGYSTSYGVMYYNGIMWERKPFCSPFTPISRGDSSLEFNFNSSIGLDWSKDWSIVYWKNPVGTYNNDFTGYNIESLGSNGNSVGGGYMWWGKYNSSNTIAGATPSQIDPKKYFGNWRMTSLQKTGATITIKEWSALEGTYVRTVTTTNTVSNFYVNQYGYDFKLGGWDNANPVNSYYRDLMVVKGRCLTDAEVTNMFKRKMAQKKDLYLQGELEEGEIL